MIYEEESDYIMRMIKEAARVLFSLIFGKKYTQVELPKENKFSVSGKGLEDFTGLADQGKINEAENMLLESIDYKNREELAAAILFYEYVSEKGEEFLRKHGYSLEEAAEGMKQIGEHAGYGELIKDLEL